MLGLSSSLVKGGASLLTFVKDNLKLYLDFNSNKSDTLKFPSEGSTEFDGSSNFIDCGDIDDVDGASALSISAWVKFDNTSDSQAIVSKYSSSTSRLEFILSSNTLFAVVANGNTMEGSFSYTSTDWNHVTMVFDGSGTGNAERLKVYLNGVNQTLSYSGTIGTSIADLGTNSFKIGNRTSNHFNGKIANIGLWSRALTPEEVQSIMNKSYSQLKGVETTSLVAWWALDDVQKVTDNSVSSGLIESETGEILSSDVKSFDSITGLGNNYTNNILEFVKNGYAFFNISGIAQGKLYRLTYTVLTQTGSGLAHSGGSSAFTGGIPTTVGSHEQYLVAGSANLLVMRSTGFRGTITDIVLQEVSMTGVVTGATTTTSVYGGNAPILPRAVDVAKEGQADAIGNGSASFVGSNTDAIVIQNGKSPSYPFTLTAWVYPELFNEYGAIYNAWVNDSLWWGVYSHSSNGLVRLHLVGGNDYIDTPSGSLPVNEWSHIATTWDGTNAKTYINGIAQTMSLTGTLAMPTAEGPPSIGVRSDNLANNPYTGDIAQLGIFAGALTQAQIQSLMESTSYSNIPADVKSTLGTNQVTNGTFDVDANWTTGTGWDIENGVAVCDGTQDGFVSVFQLNILTVDKLYKITFDLTRTAGSFRLLVGNGNPSGFYTTGGSFTLYATALGNAHLYLQGNSTFEGTVDNVVVKEVFNDIVAYYPLDSSSEVKGLSFDGINDYIDCGNDSSLQFSGSFSIGCWFRTTDATASNEHLFSKYNGGADAGFALLLDSNRKINFWYAQRGSNDSGGLSFTTIVDSGSAINDGAWHHVMGVFTSGSKVELFKDGVSVGTSTSNVGNLASYVPNLFIASQDAGNKRPLACKVSSASAYNVAKSTEEVLAIYNDGIGGDESSNSGLAGYWKMDNATTVIDNSSNSNNGTVNGATLISAGTTDSVGNNDGGLL